MAHATVDGREIHHVQRGEGEPLLTAPTLVIRGDEDQMLDVPNGPLIAARIPGARLEVPRGRRAHVLVGAPGAQRGARPLRRPRHDARERR